MTQRPLQIVLRSLAETESPVGDSELLLRFVGGDEGAFAALVRRHGRLVWSVCRHLTGSDTEADDAFQATFVVLLQNARKIRNAGRLSSWLHGVAYRICAKARRAAKRRADREHAIAAPERNGSAVPDSAWDRALAAVHEELGTLPETLRVPFVLCCLEGKGTTEAAEQLGWKLGTLSGRLTRAKDALLARLDARGLTLGAVAGLGLVAPPVTTSAKAMAMGRIGFVVPNSILQLTQGVIGMGIPSFKALAAMMLVVCGVGLVAGTGWLANADAQVNKTKPLGVPPGGAQPQADPEVDLKQLQQQLDQLQAQQDELAKMKADLERLVKQKLAKYSPFAKTAKWEYDFVVASEMSQPKFVALLQDRENHGWEFNGTTTLTRDGKPTSTWIFRRPAKGMPGATPKNYNKLGGDPRPDPFAPGKP